MGQRLELHAILKTIVPKAYFQPPDNLSMTYPCIRYDIDDADTEFADNIPYRFTWRYQLILITEDPDDPAKEKLVSLPMCRYDRHYVAGELHHYVFNIFY